MNRDSLFDWKRLIHLIKNEIVGSYRSLLVTTGALAGILLVIYLLQMIGHNSRDFLQVWYFLILFIGGFVVSSKIFSPIHDRRQNYIYLTLPASDYEKFISKLLLSSVGWVIGATVCYVLFSIIAMAVSQLIWEDSMGIFSPFKADYLTGMAVYLVLQSIFVFGSVYFQKNALAKTVGSLFLFGLCLALITGLLARLIFAKYIPWHSNWEFDCSQYFNHVVDIKAFFHGFVTVVKYLFWFGLAPFFWVLSVIRLKETEV
jgi:hypothetical protein